MLQFEVLIREGLCAIYAGAPSAVTEDEVATLYHEVLDLDISGMSAYIRPSGTWYWQDPMAKNDVPLDGTCCPCSLVVCLERSSSRPYSIGESFQRSWEQCLRRAPSLCGREVLLRRGHQQRAVHGMPVKWEAA